MNNQTNAQPQPQQSQPSFQSQQQPQQGKKTNIGIIILVIVLVLMILGGVGGYLLYLRAKKAIKTAADNASKTTTTTTSATNSDNDSQKEDIYASSKDIIPTSAYSVKINDVLKPIFANLFGGAKLATWVSSTEKNGDFSYVTKKAITTNDYSAIESAIVAKGYAKSGEAITGDGFMLTFEGSGSIIVLQYSTSLPNEIVVGANTSEGD